jgi:hypothetical protein
MVDVCDRATPVGAIINDRVTRAVHEALIVSSADVNSG